MKLYYFPLSTYSQKAVIAFREKDVSFEPKVVNLMNDEEREQYREIYPLGKVPLLVREDGWMIPESSIIIEYLDTHFETGTRLIPEDKEMARRVRFMDRMYDCYLNDSVTTLLFESWKPEAARNQEAMEKARFRLNVMYGFMNKNLDGKIWSLGDDFTMAECAAAPPLFYARQVYPFEDFENVKGYFSRLMERPSYKNVLEEAAPHLEKLKAKQAA